MQMNKYVLSGVVYLRYRIHRLAEHSLSKAYVFFRYETDLFLEKDPEFLGLVIIYTSCDTLSRFSRLTRCA